MHTDFLELENWSSNIPSEFSAVIFLKFSLDFTEMSLKTCPGPLLLGTLGSGGSRDYFLPTWYIIGDSDFLGDLDLDLETGLSEAFC